MRYSGQRIAAANDRRAHWFAEYETLITLACPDQAGKVNWDTATFHYNQGLKAAAAAGSTINRLRKP